MAVAICFPTMYDWLATIVEEMSNKMLEAIGLATAYDWAGWVSGISTMGLVTAIFGLVFVIVYFILYFQFLMRGLEILILRVGIPLACVGLIDNDKGVFKPYMSKFFQSALSVVIPVSYTHLDVYKRQVRDIYNSTIFSDIVKRNQVRKIDQLELSLIHI